MSSLLLLAAVFVLAIFGPPFVDWCLRGSDPYVFSAEQQAAYDAHVADALRTVAQAPVIPLQRRAGEGS